MTAYEPTIAQAVFGAAHSEHEADHLSDDLYRLSELLGRRNPDAQSRGLGGEFGYGQHFKNDVFEMHPYYWGDCQCHLDEAEEAWCEAHSHRADCYQSELRAAEIEAGVHHSISFEERERRHPTWESIRTAEDAIYARLLAKYNLPRAGCAVHCTCDYDSLWRDWRSNNDHAPECGIVLPNFRHFASGLEVRWYKYIGRGMSSNKPINGREFKKVIAACIASLKSANDRAQP